MNEKIQKLNKALENNFLEIWILFLQQNTARHKKMAELAGNPTRAFLAQAVYWHELLLLSEKGTDADYSIVRQSITSEAHEQFDEFLSNKRLTSSLLSELTGIPFETTRRNLKAMVSDGLLKESEQFGFLIKKDSDFHYACVSELNPLEKQNTVRLVAKILEDSDVNPSS